MKVKRISWNSKKNVKVKRERGIGFEDVLFQINNGKVLKILKKKKNGIKSMKPIR